MYIYIIYIYIEREREICVHIYIYIYIHIRCYSYYYYCAFRRITFSKSTGSLQPPLLELRDFKYTVYTLFESDTLFLECLLVVLSLLV